MFHYHPLVRTVANHGELLTALSEVKAPRAAAMTYTEAVHAFRREFLEAALRAHGGNRTQTARALGMERSHLIGLIRQYGLAASAGPAGAHNANARLTEDEGPRDPSAGDTRSR